MRLQVLFPTRSRGKEQTNNKNFLERTTKKENLFSPVARVVYRAKFGSFSSSLSSYKRERKGKEYNAAPVFDTLN